MVLKVTLCVISSEARIVLNLYLTFEYSEAQCSYKRVYGLATQPLGPPFMSRLAQVTSKRIIGDKKGSRSHFARAGLMTPPFIVVTWVKKMFCNFHHSYFVPGQIFFGFQISDSCGRVWNA